jgi:hypothetical protein
MKSNKEWYINAWILLSSCFQSGDYGRQQVLFRHSLPLIEEQLESNNSNNNKDEYKL